MSKSGDYRQRLRSLKDWTAFLMAESGLPGPRGNLELAKAFAEEASPAQIESFLSIAVEKAPENSPQVFLVFCGVAALGKQLTPADAASLARLRTFASDSRWRIREAVAIGLQYFGDQHMSALLREMRRWAKGTWYEKRAVVAALAEPKLLTEPRAASQVLKIVDGVTRAVEGSDAETSDAFRTLRQSMGYCWSVAVAALPAVGKPLFESWLTSANSDVRWILKQNLAKNRLLKMDAPWVRACLTRLTS